MSSEIDTLIIVHLSGAWQTFHRRQMLLALSECLPGHVGMLCVDRPITLDVTPWKHPGKFWAGFWRTRLESERNGRIWIVTPRMLLHDHVAGRIIGAEAVNRRLLRLQLTPLVTRLFPSIGRIIQWIYHPVQRWVWNIFPGCGSVYECYDEYTRSSDGSYHPSRWQAELRLLGEVDLTFATSQRLMDARRSATRQLEYLPNGVGEMFFDTVVALEPDPIDNLPHPRIGFLGNIYSMIDFQLLEAVFARNRRWHLILVGPVQKGVAISMLQKMKNVHFLGPRPHHLVPGIMRRLDVGLIPLLVNEYTLATNPLKLREYLATGLPVVATRLPELERFQHVIRIADNDANDFSRAIGETLSGDRSSQYSEAVAAARPFSWTNIARHSVVPVLERTFGL